MKKFLSAILIFSMLAIFTGRAEAVKVYAHNFKSTADNASLPGIAGTASTTDNTTIIFTVPSSIFSKAICFYPWIRNVNGSASTKPKINFYTSYLTDGNSDWAIFAPINSTTKQPTDYDIIMPGVTKTFNDCIPLPEGTQRIKAVDTATDNATDNITIKIVIGTK